jgi:monoamine oxidase
MATGHDVLVIGAGMAGVAAARELTRAGLSTCVVEGGERLGGRVVTVRDFCDVPVEAGAEFVHGVGAETWPDVQAAGLTVRPCPHTRDTMLDVGRGARWLPLALLHPEVWPAFTILHRLGRFRPPDLSAGQFIARHGYQGRARILAQMVLTAHLPGSVDEVGVQGLVDDGVLTLERGLNHRIVEGYDRLIDHVARGLQVRTGFTVRAVHWAPDAVTVRAEDGREVTASAAVCTLPVGVLQSGGVEFVPVLPAGKRTALAQMVMGPVLKILLHFEDRFWPARLATLASGVGPVTLYWAVSYRTPAGPALLTAYCTGPRAATLGTMSEPEAVATVLQDLGRKFPKGTSRLLAHRRIDWTSNPLSRGGYTFLRPGASGARAQLAAADTGALFWAGSETATRGIAATVEGAFTSGVRAASEVRAFLSTARPRHHASADSGGVEGRGR